MRILTIDIERSPNQVLAWGLFDQNISLAQITEVGATISWAAKWYDEKKVRFMSDFHDGHDDMVAGAHELVDAADVIVGYNSRGFDVKHLNTDFVLAGFDPPAPHRDVDLLSVARTRFRFASNKLDHVTAQLGIGTKLEHEGMALWVACMAGDPKAWAKMKRYNIQDVRLTEDLYTRLRPWVRHHPNMGVYGQAIHVCPTCGSGDVMKRGFSYTPTATFQKYQCNVCRSYSRGKDRIDGSATLRNVPM